jgi:hypothetical protein
MAKIHNLHRISSLALRQRKAALLRQLSMPPDLLRASYVERFTTCGKSNCACTRGQRHGPFYFLTACLAANHIIKFPLKTPQARQTAQHGTQAYQLFWERLEQLSQINIELLRRGEALRPPVQ